MPRSPQTQTLWEKLEHDTGRPYEEVFVEILNEEGSLEKVAARLKCSVSTVSIKYKELSIERTVQYELPSYLKGLIAARRNAEVQA